MASLPRGIALQEHLPAIPELGRPLRVVMPCVGIDGCGHALSSMKVKFTPKNVWDLESGYKEVLTKHF